MTITVTQLAKEAARDFATCERGRSVTGFLRKYFEVAEREHSNLRGKRNEFTYLAIAKIKQAMIQEGISDDIQR